MCSASTHTSQRGTCSLGYNRTITLALAIGAFLAMVYLLTFSGQFRSIDEYAMYARTESLAQGHGFYIPQIYFATYHNRIGGIEPGQPLLAVPLYLLAQLFQRSNTIAVVMLFNTLVTALQEQCFFAAAAFLLNAVSAEPSSHGTRFDGMAVLT